MLRPRVWLYLLPTLLFLLVFTYVPIFYVFIQGWQQFPEVIQDPDTLNSLWVTFIYLVIVVPGAVILGLLSALAVQQRTKTQVVARAILFHPVILPMIAFAAIWLYLMNPTSGPLTDFLVRLTNRNINLLGDPSLTLISIAFVGILKDFGLYMLFFLAGLQSIPRDVLEAALVDGATRWTRFWRITLPLLGPTVFYVGVIAFLWTIRNVDHVYILTPRGGITGETELILFRIYQVAFEYYEFAEASALSMILFGIILIIALLTLPRIERGIYYAG